MLVTLLIEPRRETIYIAEVFIRSGVTVAPANMFDASGRQTCKVRSSVTSTPLHALTTLNDITWSEAARVIAERAMQSSDNVDDQLQFAFNQVLGRDAKENEIAILQRALKKQHEFYAADEATAQKVVSIGEAIRDKRLNVADHASMAAVCLAILNMDEALTRE